VGGSWVIKRAMPIAVVAAALVAGPALAQSTPSRLETPLTGTPLNVPAAGHTFLCEAGPGSVLTNANTPWVHGTFINTGQIPHVSGSVNRHSEYKVTTTATRRILKGNGLPDTPIGQFPVKKGTPAYPYYAALPAQGYDNASQIPVKPWDLDISIPRFPKVNPEPTCIARLTIGVANTGAPWHVEIAPDSQYNLLSPSAGLPMDKCWGHPYATQYHYHGASWTCFKDKNKKGEPSPLVGYAIDGFGVYGINGENGKPVKNSQLDECHGMVSRVKWEGRMVRMYHYVLNNEYPYSIGCFRGTPAFLPPQAS
jgi:hypothetical protein